MPGTFCEAMVTTNNGSATPTVAAEGGLGALDPERPGLRVEEAHPQVRAREVGGRAQGAAERVVAPQAQHAAGLDLADLVEAHH